jgi:hypothetical protein
MFYFLKEMLKSVKLIKKEDILIIGYSYNFFFKNFEISALSNKDNEYLEQQKTIVKAIGNKEKFVANKSYFKLLKHQYLFLAWATWGSNPELIS